MFFWKMKKKQKKKQQSQQNWDYDCLRAETNETQKFKNDNVS